MKLATFLTILFFLSLAVKSEGRVDSLSKVKLLSNLTNTPPDRGYDCSVLRNYRDENGNFTCPTTDYEACLDEYGPRLPPPYFPFVKHWCWCNCVYDPDDL